MIFLTLNNCLKCYFCHVISLRLGLLIVGLRKHLGKKSLKVEANILKCELRTFPVVCIV